MDSEGWGATLIHRELERRYGEGVISQRAVSKWIASNGITEKREDPLPWQRWQPDLLQRDIGWLLRLELVTKAMIDRDLFQEEARWAIRLELALQGLSLLAQWAVVEEYARRHLNSRSPETDDLDFMLATRPWCDEGLIARAASHDRASSIPTIQALVIPEFIAQPAFGSLFGTVALNSYTFITPRVSKRMFDSLGRTHTRLRVVLHISQQLHQPVVIRPGWTRTKSRIGGKFLDIEDRNISTNDISTNDPNEKESEEKMSEEDLLLLDLLRQFKVRKEAAE